MLYPSPSLEMLPARSRLEKENHRKMGETELWKSFGNETEAGRLLKKLYAGLEKANGVKYPKLRTKEQHGDRPQFIPGGGKDGRSDPRVKNLKESKIVVPKFGRPKPVGLGKGAETAGVGYERRGRERGARVCGEIGSERTCVCVCVCVCVCDGRVSEVDGVGD